MVTVYADEKYDTREYFGEYRDMVVEIDAVTGEITDLDMYKADNYTLEPPYHAITLHRIWAKLELEENGPLYLARLAVIHKFADLSYDCPEEDSIPIFKETFWTPEIDALPGAANVQDALAAIMAAFVSGTVTNNSVFTAAIQDGAVTNPKLADGAVTEPKIADGAVTWGKIGAGAVTNSKVDFSGGLNVAGTLYPKGELILKSGVTYGNSTTGQTPTAGRIFFKKVQ